MDGSGNLESAQEKSPEATTPEKTASEVAPRSLRSEEKVPQPESNLVGRKVRKHFEGFGWYQGTVMRHWKSEEYGDQFHVIYTDGDAEDLSREILMKHLLPVTPQLSAKEIAPVKQDPPRAPTPPERQQNLSRAPTPPQTFHARSRSSESTEGPTKFARLDQTQYSPHPSEKSFQYNNDSPASQSVGDRQLQRKSSLSGIAFHGEQNAWHNGSQFVQRPSTTSSTDDDDRFQRFQGPQALPSVAQRTSFLSPQPPPAYFPEQGPYSHTYIKSELPRLPSSSSMTSQQREESYPPPAHVKPKPMIPLAQDQTPLGRLNYHFLKAIKDTTQNYKFGEAFTCVLRDDPGYTNGMDITRLMQYCHQRRYPRINLFLNDVVKMRNTVSSTYPQDFAFRQQAGEYIDVLTRCIQELAPVLRQIEAIIIAEEDKPTKFY